MSNLNFPSQYPTPQPKSSGGMTTIIIIAVVVIVLGVVGYFGYQQYIAKPTCKEGKEFLNKDNKCIPYTTCEHGEKKAGTADTDRECNTSSKSTSSTSSTSISANKPIPPLSLSLPKEISIFIETPCLLFTGKPSPTIGL